MKIDASDPQIERLLQTLQRYADKQFTGTVEVRITLSGGGIARLRVFEVVSTTVAS